MAKYGLVKVGAVCAIALLFGLLIGVCIGSYLSLNWVAEKAVYFMSYENGTIIFDAQKLAAALSKYKYKVDLLYPT